MILGIVAQLLEYAVPPNKNHLAIDCLRPVPLEKVLVAVCRMKRAHPHATVGIGGVAVDEVSLLVRELIVAYPKVIEGRQFTSSSFRPMGFPSTGGAIQYYLLLALKYRLDATG